MKERERFQQLLVDASSNPKNHCLRGDNFFIHLTYNRNKQRYTAVDIFSNNGASLLQVEQGEARPIPVGRVDSSDIPEDSYEFVRVIMAELDKIMKKQELNPSNASPQAEERGREV